MSDSDVLIVGAGITGATIAYSLAQTGLRVTIVEAQNATSGAAQFTAGLAWAQSPEINLGRLAHFARQLGVNAQNCHATEASSDGTDQIESLRIGSTREALIVNVADLTQRLLAHERINYRADCEITEITEQGDVLIGQSSSFSFPAKNVVLACGAFSSLLLPELAASYRIAQCVQWLSMPLDKTLTGIPHPLIANGGMLQMIQGHDMRVRVNTWHDALAAALPKIDIDRQTVERFVRRHLRQTQTSDWHAHITAMPKDHLPIIGRTAITPRLIFAINSGINGLAWVLHVADRVSTLIV